MRSRRFGRTVATLAVAGIALSLFGGIVSAEAIPARYRCTFGPDDTTFNFNSLPGLGNDTLQVEGTGTCRIISKCFRARMTCTMRGRISGFSSEQAGQNLLHFGSCDQDPAAGRPDALFSTITLTLTIPSRAVSTTRFASIRSAEICPPADAPRVPCLYGSFPSPGGPNDVRFFGAEGGGGYMFTRVGGRCPPDGSDHATYLDIEFVA